MKKLFFIVMLLMLASLGPAQEAWTVRSVPNTRLESDLIHVSDPDDILSDSCEHKINTALASIRDQADVFVVVLNSIGSADIDVFANELFNNWGIGDAELDNGVLILLAKEQREIKFETGYGVEETLPDALCQRFFEEAIVPYFKEGDYESGLSSGVTQIVQVYGGAIPDGLVSMPPVSREGYGTDDDISFATIFMFLIAAGLLFFLPFIALVYYAAVDRNAKPVSSLADNDSVIDGVHYIDVGKKKWDGNRWGGVGCLKALMYGLSIYLFVFIGFFIEQMRVGSQGESNYGLALLYGLLMYLTWICIRQNGRALRVADKLARTSPTPKQIYEIADRKRLTRFTRWMAFWIGWVYGLIFKSRIKRASESRCLECERAMQPFSRFRYTPVQQKEMDLRTVEYTPYICDFGHVTVMKEVKNLKYHECEVCHGITQRVLTSKVLSDATYEKVGTKEVVYHCEFCGHDQVVTETIPKLYHSGSGSSTGGYASRSSRSYHSSSHRSGGSFGGGRSGGGGYHGKW